jgi:protein phosphatase
MKGKNNEDRYGVSAHLISKSNATPSVLAVIADGVGGHRAGEVAAEMAVEIISRGVAESDASQPVNILNQAIIQASQAIYSQSLVDPAQQGMSTTCVCAWVIGDRLYTASVGDSRIYLVRDGVISQLTTDHTWVQEAIETGVLTPEQARNHPNAHVIRRHLGSQQLAAPDFRLRLDPKESDAQAEANQGLRMRLGDRLLLCSDGLTDLVTDEEILEGMVALPLEDVLARLVNMANGRGGHDNITLVSLQVAEPEAVPAGPPARARRSALSWILWGFLALVVLGGALVVGFFWLGFGSGAEANVTPTTAPIVQPSFIPPEVIVPMSTTAATASPVVGTPTPAATTTPISTAIGGGPTYTPWPTSTQVPQTSQPLVSR